MKMRTRRRTCQRRTKIEWSSARIAMIHFNEARQEARRVFEKAVLTPFYEAFLKKFEAQLPNLD